MCNEGILYSFLLVAIIHANTSFVSLYKPKGYYFEANEGDKMFIEKRIQKPGTIFPRNNCNINSWYEAPPLGYSYLNLWAINNILGDYSQEMVDKTIYDPYPAGFTITGENSEDSSKSAEWNVADTREKGFEQNWGFNF